VTTNKRTGSFPSTSWSRVFAAGNRSAPECHEALTALCNAYWYPIYAFIRRKGRRSEEALDLTQDYFARLLERGTVAAADPLRGRFRSFLLADCTRFLADRHAHDNALKRGGGIAIVSIDGHAAEGRYQCEPVDDRTPERIFVRAWAVALLERVLSQLRGEYEASGRGPAFDVLKLALAGSPETVSHAELALRLRTTTGAVQVAVHRLRRRFRDLVRQQIAATVADPEEIEEEVRDLLAALAG
jgi:RNA polymerase sigma-70 factor (ECF subfamily)